MTFYDDSSEDIKSMIKKNECVFVIRSYNK